MIELKAKTPLVVSKGEKGLLAKKRRVLFLCTHNAARSQMAEGFLRHLYWDKYEAFSAGASPTRVNPLAIRAMSEVGIDISGHRSKSIEEFRGQDFDLVATVCVSTSKLLCPFCSTRPLSMGKREVPEAIRTTVNAKKWIEHGFADPSEVEGGDEEKLTAFRRTRDEIAKWITDYFADLELIS